MNPAAGSLLLSQHQQHGPHTAVPELVWSSSSSPTAVAAAVNAPSGSAVASSQVATCGSPLAFAQLLQRFPEVVNPSKKLPAATHGVQHHIVTTGPPVSSKFRRLDGEKLAAAKAEFAAMERDGIVQRSSSPWASPLHMVRKSDGSWRPCGDSRRLNLATVPDAYPLPNMLMSSRVVWRCMASDIAGWCCDCQQCNRAKVTSQEATTPIQPMPIPHRRFSHIHVDIVGPLPTSVQGFNCIFTVIDRSSRWVEAVPIKNQEAATCADALVATWISRFGVPDTITSDKGTQFCSSTWKDLCNRLAVNHITTTAYHPQSNGMVERVHHQIKDSLRARLAGSQWPEHLPWVLLGIRAAPKEDSAISSAELVYGVPLHLPGQIASEAESPPDLVAGKLRAVQPPPTRPLTYAQAVAVVPASLLQAAFVYVRRGGVVPPLEPLYQGPYRVIRRTSKFFLLQIGEKTEAVSVDRLKPHLGQAPVVPASPKPRGRPPRAAPLGRLAVSARLASPAASTGGGPL